MHKINLSILLLMFGVGPVMAADFSVAEGESLTTVVRDANGNTDDVNTVNISGTVSGGGSPEKSINIIGSDSATISGSLSFSGGKGMTTTVSDVTVGRVDNGDGFPPQEGHTLILKNVNISNAASAAIANDGALIVDGGVYSNNKNGSNGGGAIMNITVDTTYIKGGAKFENNSTTDSGGAIQNQSTGAMDIRDSSFTGNYALYYGGAVRWGGNGDIVNTVFENNSANVGGALYTTDSSATLNITGGEFNGNHSTVTDNAATGYGGAIRSVSALNITDVIFDGNYAQSGGAIEQSGLMTVKGGEFKNNYALGYGGGAIDYEGAGLSIADTKFTNNQARATSGNGGAIYASGTFLEIDGDAEFKNNTAGDSGGAIYTQAQTTITGTKDNFIEFENNTATAGEGGAITYSNSKALNLSYASFTGNKSGSTSYGGGALYAAGTGNIIDNVNFSSNTATNYGGALFLSSAKDAKLTNVLFDGNTAALGGAIMAYEAATTAITIGGNSSFTNNTAQVGGAIFNMGILNLDTTLGDITFAGNKALGGGADIYNNDDPDALPTINILGDTGTLSIDGGIGGMGYINKSGANTFIIKALTDNSQYSGTFTQTGGVTTVETARSMFSGGIAGNHISNSTLNVTGSLYSYGVTLGNNGALNHFDRLNNTSVIDDTNLAFDGSGAIATFGSIDTERANYILGTKIDNAMANYVTFNDSNVFLRVNDYTGGTRYTFNDSDISLSGPNQTLRTVTFDKNFAATNSTLSFDIYAQPISDAETFLSDQLVIKNPTGKIEIGLGTLRILGKEDNGLTNITVDNVLTGATFKDGAQVYISTTAYEYLVKANGTGLTLDAIEASSAESLNNMTKRDGNRAFNFSYFEESETYEIADSLDTMAAGNFAVTGFNDIASSSIIEAGGDKSMFDVLYATNFTVSNLTIQNVLKTGESTAGALRVMNKDAVVNIDNVIFKGNKTTDSDDPIDEHGGGYGGAAIWQSSGILSVQNSQFNGNDSERGGAIYIEGPSTTEIINSKFVGNYAREKHGGAIEVLDTDSIVFDTVKFDDNHAAMWGGAISFNEGTDSYGSDNFADGVNFYGYNEFTNNTAAYGGAININMVNSAPVNFHGDVLFENNTAEDTLGLMGGVGIGGAISSSQNHGGDRLTFNGNAVFRNNKSLSDDSSSAAGGALYVVSVDTPVFITFNGGRTLFENNHTDGVGGAIGFGSYSETETSILAFNMKPGADIKFTGNTDASGANDIYFDGVTSHMNINGKNGKMTLNGGIASYHYFDEDTQTEVGTNAVVNMNSTGVLEFGADSINNNFMGTFNATDGITNIRTDSWIMGDNFVSNGATMHFFKSSFADGMDLSKAGNLDLRGEQLNRLTVNNWASDGSGNLWLSTDGVTSDVLAITGSATGATTVNMTVLNGGVASRGEDILVVDTSEIPEISLLSFAGAGTNDASFSLAGGKNSIDIGAYEYGLFQQEDNNWYLSRTGKVSNMAETIGGIPALHLSVVKSGMNELRKRLGALRNNNPNDELVGAWVRGYGKHLQTDDHADSEMNLLGIEGGFDLMANMLNGKVYFGVMAGMLNSEDVDVTTSRGAEASGWVRTPSVGAYLTWMHRSDSYSKWFVDLTARHFWVHTNIEREDEANGYDVRRNFWAFSGEVGKLFYVESPEWMNIGEAQHSHLSLEPKFEVRYGRGQSMDFETFDGTAGYVDTTTALSTRLYLQTNFLPNGTVSTWKPFLEVGVYNEWSGKTEMEFADSELCASNTRGLGFEATLGTNATISERTYAYGAVTVEAGKVYNSYMFNIGIRTKF